MEIVYDDATLRSLCHPGRPVVSPPAIRCSSTGSSIRRDRDRCRRALRRSCFLTSAGSWSTSSKAGIHSGDSACALPPITIGRGDVAQVRAATEAIARGVGVRGLLNVQYALAGGVLYVLEANPRASRTVPFVSKATAVPLAKAAARIMLGSTIAALRAEGLLRAEGDGGNLPLDAPVAVKEAVLPFGRFRDPAGAGVDTVLGPEMRSTGEVMGIDNAFGTAFAKSQAAVYGSLPVQGRVFVSVANRDKRAMVFPVKRLADLGFEIWATSGTAEVLRRNGVRAKIVRKHGDGPGPDGDPTVVTRILAGEVDLIVNTPFGSPRTIGRAPGRLRDPHRRGPPRHPVRHHGRRARRRRARDRGHHPRRGGRAVAPGARRPDHAARRASGGTLMAPVQSPRHRADLAARRRLSRADAGRARHRDQVPARPVHHDRGRRPGDRHARAACLRRARRAPRPRRHGGVRVRGPRAGHALAGLAARQGRAGRGGAARPALSHPQGPVELPAARRRLRQRAAVRAGGAAA